MVQSIIKTKISFLFNLDIYFKNQTIQVFYNNNNN